MFRKTPLLSFSIAVQATAGKPKLYNKNYCCTACYNLMFNLMSLRIVNLFDLLNLHNAICTN